MRWRKSRNWGCNRAWSRCRVGGDGGSVGVRRILWGWGDYVGTSLWGHSTSLRGISPTSPGLYLPPLFHCPLGPHGGDAVLLTAAVQPPPYIQLGRLRVTVGCSGYCYGSLGSTMRCLGLYWSCSGVLWVSLYIPMGHYGYHCVSLQAAMGPTMGPAMDVPACPWLCTLLWVHTGVLWGSLCGGR